MKVIDCHAHPPRKGYPAIDPRPYIFPQSDEDRDVLLEREARELLANMDNYQVDQKIMLAFPPDMEHEFHYGEFNVKTGVTSYTSHQWISRLVKRYRPICRLRLFKPVGTWCAGAIGTLS